MIGGGGPKMLALAGRHADIAGILPAPIRGDEDSDDPADRAPAALEAKLAVLRDAAGERFGQLEISTFATFRVTSQRRRDTEDLIRQRGWQGIGCEQVWAMPTVFIGSAGQISAGPARPPPPVRPVLLRHLRPEPGAAGAGHRARRGG